MAIIAGILAAGAAIGSLLTYSGTKLFSDSPSTSHVQTIVKNEIAAHVDADNTHEAFQNNLIIIVIGVVALICILSILRYAVIGFRVAKRSRSSNNNGENHNMNAINIDV